MMSKISKRANKATKSPPISHVRIIGGEYRRRLVAFIDADGLRPTPDRVRETIFNWLADDLVNAKVLDCCAGSGVLGFEALSRGAKQLTCIEPNHEQFRHIKATQALLGIDDTKIVTMEATIQHALPQLANTEPFDVVFIDPPYQLALWGTILHGLINHQLIHPQTLLYIESDQDHTQLLESFTASLEPIKYKKMGQIFAGIYQPKTL